MAARISSDSGSGDRPERPLPTVCTFGTRRLRLPKTKKKKNFIRKHTITRRMMVVRIVLIWP